MSWWVPGFEGGCLLRAGRRCAPCTSSPWTFTVCLHFLCLIIIGWHIKDPSPNYFGVADYRWSVDRSFVNVRLTVCLIWRTTGLLKDWLTWVDPCRRPQCVGETQAIPFPPLSQTPRLNVDVSWGAKHCFSENVVRPFATFLDPVTFLGLERSCIGN